uniref:NADP-dependent oxidoreductase domain-containing protein n=1 Tax=Pseudo-nitzschia australis TaxID=44445 RepID=A0A7S4AWR0_9STRA|mmetsp:Transcript_20005/g.43509  ORF Transcript_20005/g.43509 Transcript_20005/m.43509 type:complete len:428 (-) Transcript_20005:2543-3826(-)|eukprot:CAMPEP_0168187732 /NCGR_PEP_ID=MMETSP0139_2-20121125/15206_1 /TAXON_ID=44445 /ORGANISM="Pseudo-nitzschia australis, Strain 10249 10 AB" /LENGTH=427 /DNA_ID=CAMNT_0008109993 /DNA_START=151 /DNA_END=1434 /DNA_ORIENTATION=+
MTFSTFLPAVVSAFVLLACHPLEAYVGVPKSKSKAPLIIKHISKPKSVDTTKIGSITVPTVGTGTISWSSNSLFSTENKDLEEVVTEAYRSNAAFFDTAERYGSHFKTAFGMGYGETERMTSKYLEKARLNEGRSLVEPVVATKFTPVPWRTTVQSVVDACEQSCKNLGVDQLDLYQIHMPDIVQPLRAFGKVETKDSIYWEGLAECYNRGLVKNVGVCNYGPTLVEECHEALAKKGVPLASNQISFSLLGRHNGSQETIHKCNELGVKVLAYYPFAMGLLTGKYSNELMDENDLNPKDLSLTLKKKSNLELADLERYAYGDGVSIPEGGIQPLLKTMASIAKKRKKTLAQIALNYIISKGAIPIPGCRTVEQLEDNMGAMGWRLSPIEVKMLELEADKLGFDFDGAGLKRTNEKFVGYGVEKWTLD